MKMCHIVFKNIAGEKNQHKMFIFHTAVPFIYLYNAATLFLYQYKAHFNVCKNELRNCGNHDHYGLYGNVYFGDGCCCCYGDDVNYYDMIET